MDLKVSQCVKQCHKLWKKIFRNFLSGRNFDNLIFKIIIQFLDPLGWKRLMTVYYLSYLVLFSLHDSFFMNEYKNEKY